MLGLQVSDVLAKVVRQQAEVVDLAEKRAEVLSCIEEFEAVRAECRWLTEYEHDEMRYKVSTFNCLAYWLCTVILFVMLHSNAPITQSQACCTRLLYCRTHECTKQPTRVMTENNVGISHISVWQTVGISTAWQCVHTV